MVSDEEMLKELMHEVGIETVKGRSADLVRSFNKQNSEGRKLSDRQRSILMDMYQRYVCE